MADFNGDGFADLAVTNFSSGSDTVSVLLGNGDGTFRPIASYRTGSGSLVVAVGDFNRDGIADLAVTNLNSNNISVLLGNGDGTFQAANEYFAVTNPLTIAVGDFNGDGNPDLAIVGESSGQAVSVLLGNGDGSFKLPVNYPIGTITHPINTGDFNGDGKLDLVLADSGNVILLLGNGDGTFQTPISYAIGNNAQSVVVADFNGDGIADIATANFGTNNVSVLLGTAQTATQLKFTSQPSNGLAGTAIGPVLVQVQDTNGNLVVTSNASVTMTSNPAGVTIQVNAVNGVAAFNNVTFNYEWRDLYPDGNGIGDESSYE